ncbi:hypothetical protein PYCC9005_001251 [Savitreella phatthalungensis]
MSTVVDSTRAADLSQVHATSQTSFTSNASLYDKARPSYIPEAVDALIANAELKQGSKVLDLACGTGKFTALLAAKGIFDLEAAEPSPGMIDVFKQVVPGVKITQAGAYDLPFPDNHFDCVTIAQAFHWFADETALTEIARVIKPGGHLACIWNLEKYMGESKSKLGNRLFEVVQIAHDGKVPQYRKGDWRTAMDATKQFQLPFGEWTKDFELHYTEEQIWERSLSKSFITSLDPETKEKCKQDIAQAFKDFGDEAPKDAQGKYILPQDVRVVWLKKP